MGDMPAISPDRPGGDIKVEMQKGNMICVTENNDTENRSCVPVVHNTENDVDLGYRGFRLIRHGITGSGLIVVKPAALIRSGRQTGWCRRRPCWNVFQRWPPWQDIRRKYVLE
jgi:hypothetical protein